ncbi:MAG: hypothetical protein IJ733_09545 [Lachnospiraceae bacterium]|nr:hypothetical protein [Lachnospiraceae bacterium]
MKRIRFSVILASICGIPLLAAGLYFLSQAKNVEKLVSVEAGGLKVAEAPEDVLFKVSTETPLLIRKVEMYQYCFIPEKYSSGQDERGNDIYRKYVEKGFSERERGTENAYDNPEFKGSTKRYENPKFPKDLKSSAFYGKRRSGKMGCICLSIWQQNSKRLVT